MVPDVRKRTVSWTAGHPRPKIVVEACAVAAQDVAVGWTDRPGAQARYKADECQPQSTRDEAVCKKTATVASLTD